MDVNGRCTFEDKNNDDEYEDDETDEDLGNVDFIDDASKDGGDTSEVAHNSVNEDMNDMVTALQEYTIRDGLDMNGSGMAQEMDEKKNVWN